MMIGKSVKHLWELYGYNPNEVDADELKRQRIVTEEELDSLTASYPAFLRNNLDWAFYGLERVLERKPHIKENWRELVAMYRADALPKKDTLICNASDGETLEVSALIDRSCFKYREIEPAVMHLVQEIDAIADFDPAQHISSVILEEATRINAKHAADAKHDGPNGKRKAKDEIKEIWASGKYSSRDRCAEEECGALDMSFSTARKALRGTPDPA